MQHHAELTAAIALAKEAGEILRRHFGTLLSIEMKGRRDFFTQVDTESDELIRAGIVSRFPGDEIISEESGRLNSGSSRKWIIDPLDGTWAYTRGTPESVPSVSIAFAEGGEPVVGVIYAPLANLGKGELFQGVRGYGTSRNGVPMHVNEESDLAQATVVHDVGKKDRWRIARVTERLLQNNGVMASPSFGGAASTLARVAAGQLGGAATIGLDLWDVAAAVVLLKEAGALVTDLAGAVWSFDSNSLVAANPVLHKKIIELIGS